MDFKAFKYQLCDNSRRINEVINTFLAQWGAAYGLSAMQIRILMEIGENGNLTVGAIANNIMLAGTNISTMCKKLEQLGFVKRARDGQDERIVRIELTEMGMKVIRAVDQSFENKINSALGEDPVTSYKAISSAMELLNDLLNQLAEQKGEE